MTWSHIHIHRPVSVTLSLILIFVYSIWLIFFIGRARHTAALVALTIPPLLLGAFATWIGYANVLRAMALSGGGRASTAAGVADALELLRFGGGVTAFCSAIAIAAVVRRRDDAIAQLPRSSSVVAVLCWIMSGASLVMPTLFPPRGSFTAWNVSLIAGFVCLALLIPLAVVAIVGHRRTIARGTLIKALAVALFVTLAEIAIAWTLIEHYRTIAMGG